MRKLVLGVITLLIFLSLMPLLVGVWLQHRYSNFLILANTSANFKVQILNYHRHWLDSDINLLVEIPTSEWKSLLEFTNTTKLPATLQFFITQHVKHGLLFYFPFGVGLAEINTQLKLTPDEVHDLDLKRELIATGNDQVSLLGKYLMKWQFNDLNWHSKYEDNTRIQLGQINTKIWIIGQKHLSGNIDINKIHLLDENGIISIPQMQISFNHTLNDLGLWIGDYTIAFPKMTIFSSEDNTILVVSDISYASKTKEHAALLNALRELHIGKLRYANEVLGPLSLEFGLYNINMHGIADIIKTYNSTLQSGELYQGQLRHKISAKLVDLLNEKTSLKLNQFDLVTPKGIVKMSSQITWPMENLADITNLQDLAEAARVNLQLHIPKAMLNQVIAFASKFNYFKKPISNVERDQLLQMENQLDFFLKTSRFEFDQLVSNYILPEEIGSELFEMQQQFSSKDEYKNRIKDLLLTREITLPMSYYLYWSYLQTEEPYETLINLTTKYQKDAEIRLHKEFNALRQQGYVTEERDNSYVISLRWADGLLKMNE